MRRFLYILFFCLISIQVSAQTVRGVVLDRTNRRPMEYVSVIVKGTNVGVSTDANGWFEIPVKTLPCTLSCVFVGYYTQDVEVDSYKKEIKVVMNEDVESLQAVIVKPDDSYVLSILQKIVDNKKNNNPEKQKNISYNDYSRTSVFVTNLANKFVDKSKSLKKVSDAFIPMTDSTVMMPLLISEKVTSHVKDSSSNIHSSEQKAEEYESVLAGLGQQVQSFVEMNIATEYNFYDNQLNVVLRGFPSPISSSYQLFYRYYLTDSLVVGDVKYYKIKFFPKNQKTIAFIGEFWVENRTWALTEIKAALPKAANINFVSNFKAEAKFQALPEGGWFVHQQRLNFDLSLVNDSFTASTKVEDMGPADGTPSSEDGKKKKITMAFQKSNKYSIINDSLLLSDMNEEASDSLLAAERESLPMTKSEKDAFNGMELLQKTPQARFVDKLGSFLLYGYLNVGPIDIGHSSLLYHVNEIEGQRLSLPLRTSEKLWKDFTVGGYLGYGFRNREFAYGGNFAYRFKSSHRAVISANFRYDYLFITQNRFKEFVQENPYQKGAGNILSSVTTFNPNPYLTRSIHGDISFEYDINSNVSMMIRPAYDRYESNRFVPFAYKGAPIDAFETQSVLFDLRYSREQHYDDEYFAKIYYNNLQPVFHFSAITGRYDYSCSGGYRDAYYAQLNLSIKGRLNLGPCYLLYLVEGGGILGNIPFPLLKLPQGSGDLGFSRNNYNLLNNASFASDLYMTTHLSLNTGGIILNVIPFLKRFNLREVFGFKMFYGGLLGRHYNAMDIPQEMGRPILVPPSMFPYMEGSVGITNIFKILRIDYCFRINTSKLDNVSTRHGIKLMLELSF